MPQAPEARARAAEEASTDQAAGHHTEGAKAPPPVWASADSAKEKGDQVSAEMQLIVDELYQGIWPKGKEVEGQILDEAERRIRLKWGPPPPPPLQATWKPPPVVPPQAPAAQGPGPQDRLLWADEAPAEMAVDSEQADADFAASQDPSAGGHQRTAPTSSGKKGKGTKTQSHNAAGKGRPAPLTDFAPKPYNRFYVVCAFQGCPGNPEGVAPGEPNIISYINQDRFVHSKADSPLHRCKFCQAPWPADAYTCPQIGAQAAFEYNRRYARFWNRRQRQRMRDSGVNLQDEHQVRAWNEASSQQAFKQVGKFRFPFDEEWDRCRSVEAQNHACGREAAYEMAAVPWKPPIQPKQLAHQPIAAQPLSGKGAAQLVKELFATPAQSPPAQAADGPPPAALSEDELIAKYTQLLEMKSRYPNDQDVLRAIGNHDRNYPHLAQFCFEQSGPAPPTGTMTMSAATSAAAGARPASMATPLLQPPLLNEQALHDDMAMICKQISADEKRLASQQAYVGNAKARIAKIQADIKTVESDIPKVAQAIEDNKEIQVALSKEVQRRHNQKQHNFR